MRFVSVLGFSVFFAAIPIGLYLAALSWAGLDEGRAPTQRTGSAVLWGAAGAVTVGLLWATALGRPLAALTGRGERLLVESVFTVPLAEELAKAVVFVLLLRNRRIVTALLGLVIGGAAGLGFAMTENFAYFLHTWLAYGGEAWFSAVVLRTFFSGLLHACATGAFGAALGYATTHPHPVGRRLWPYAGFSAAFALHAGWNLAFALTGVSGEPLPAAVGMTAVPLTLLVMVALAYAAVGHERRQILDELGVEEEAGVIGPHHARVLARPKLRSRAGWLPEGVDRRRYVSLALKLANERRYLRTRGGDPDGGDDRRLDSLRDRLRQALAGVDVRTDTEPPSM